jgi:mono/diheme cytochrome c family protein
MSLFRRGMVAASGVALSALAFVPTSSAAEKVTFTKDVLPILQEHCQDCHRPGGANMGGMVAPMAFIDYKDTRPWSKAIAKAVSAKKMPPWAVASAHSGEFEGERGLSQEEIDTIVSWVETGAVRGAPKDAPAPREFPATDGWAIGEPDLIFSMPDPYFMPDDVTDETKYFPMKLTDEQMPKDRWIQSVEFRPGSEVVHHIILTPFGGIAPGNKPSTYREGFSAKAEKNQRVVWNMHYHKEPGQGSGMWDQSTVGIKFYPEDYTPDHVLTTKPLGPMDIYIPAGAKRYENGAEMTFEKDSLIYSMMPHMHYRGTEVKYELTYPDGKQETILHVPEYDFNWQTSYRFKDLKEVPAGTKIKLTGWWDNSTDNPFNPDPTKDVAWGEATDEEMLFGWLSYTAKNEDHNRQVRKDSDD